MNFEKPQKKIDIDIIDKLPNKFPDELIDFFKNHNLKLPNIKSGNGIALAVMVSYPKCYWDRETCDKFVEKFNIKTKDSIQFFNKHNQKGIKTNSDFHEKGKLYICYPYSLSNKGQMRKNFKFDGTDDVKNKAIDEIKSKINADYIDAPNEQWQLGHKNPGSNDNTSDNLVLQPPIQGKYRDNYIFIDTLTKFPVPSKLATMIEKKDIEFTPEQIKDYKAVFDKLSKLSDSI